MATALATFGLLVGLMSYFQAGMVERERFEQLEVEELSKTRGGQSLFTSAGEDTFPARRSRQQFEKIVAPCFTGLLLILQIGAAYLPWTRLTTSAAVHQRTRDTDAGAAGIVGNHFVRAGEILNRAGAIGEPPVIAPRGVLFVIDGLCLFCGNSDPDALMLGGFSKIRFVGGPGVMRFDGVDRD